ncbi:DUF1129 family protein [Metaclostridioides mangenotii]|uniref:DUF1129 family protein n=1 Tax=Metaclostridioides mangenotii TaxID=1540 RepID=UPI0028EDE01F|nr:DUF1129 family protein [Clostridioides mangenotii]
MKNKVEYKIEKNNQLREQLNIENEEYYDDLLVYMRLKGGLFYDNDQIEDILLVILDDIIDAQKDGISAYDYFGKNPKEVADAMMKEITPSSLLSKFKYIMVVFGIYFLMTIFPSLVSPDKNLDIGKIFIGFIITSVFVIFILNSVKQSIYVEDKSKGKFFSKAKLFIVSFIGLLLLILSKSLLPDILPITIDGLFGIAFIIALIIVASWYCLKKGNELFKPFLSIIYTSTLISIGYRIPEVSTYLQSRSGKTIVVASLLISLFIFYFFTHKLIKNNK